MGPAPGKNLRRGKAQTPVNSSVSFPSVRSGCMLAITSIAGFLQGTEFQSCKGTEPDHGRRSPLLLYFVVALNLTNSDISPAALAISSIFVPLAVCTMYLLTLVVAIRLCCSLDPEAHLLPLASRMSYWKNTYISLCRRSAGSSLHLQSVMH